MFCPYCGKKISPNIKFCPYCGHDVTNVKASNHKPMPLQRSHAINTKHSFKNIFHHNKRGFWITLIVIVVILCSFSAYHRHHMNNIQTTQQQSSQNNQSQNKQNNQNNSQHFGQPTPSDSARKTITDTWVQASGDASNGKGPWGQGSPKQKDGLLIKQFQGGQSNHDYQTLNKLINNWQNSSDFSHDGLGMTPHIKSVHKDGNKLDVTYQVDYFFPAKNTTNSDNTIKSGLYEGFIWHATTTKDGTKIITNKANNSHPVYKHVNHSKGQG